MSKTVSPTSQNKVSEQPIQAKLIAPTVSIDIISKSGEIPVYAKEGDAGADLKAYLPEGSIIIQAGERALIPTGLSMAIPDGYEGQVRSRSGLAVKDGIMVLNSPGTIDSGYRGEVKVILYNTSRSNFIVKNGDRIAQLAINKVEKGYFSLIASLEETDRGIGGFGSTGV